VETRNSVPEENCLTRYSRSIIELMSNLSKQETLTLVSLLGKCKSGQLGAEVFTAIARLTVSCAIEVVPLRSREGKVEVLLIERPKNDPLWANMVHTPGTVLRTMDNSLNDGFERIFKSELGVKRFNQPNFMGISFGHGARGASVGIEHWIELNSEPVVGRFYDVNFLPHNFINEQRELLTRAIKAFTN